MYVSPQPTLWLLQDESYAVKVSGWGYQRSAGVTAVIQVLSRYWALWGIVEVAPQAVKHGALKLFSVGDVTLQLNLITLLFCWSLTEILRYGFYAAKVGLNFILPQLIRA